MQRVEHQFVEFVPERLEPNTLYISMDYATVVHSCLCGCGQRVITPLTPTDWRLAYDGETVSLSRSIGNWSFPCRSHYWIEHSRVHWAGAWSEDKIEANRAADLELKRRFYEGGSREPVLDESDAHGFDTEDLSSGSSSARRVADRSGALKDSPRGGRVVSSLGSRKGEVGVICVPVDTTIGLFARLP